MLNYLWGTQNPKENNEPRDQYYHVLVELQEKFVELDRTREQRIRNLANSCAAQRRNKDYQENIVKQEDLFMSRAPKEEGLDITYEDFKNSKFSKKMEIDPELELLFKRKALKENKLLKQSEIVTILTELRNNSKSKIYEIINQCIVRINSRPWDEYSKILQEIIDNDNVEAPTYFPFEQTDKILSTYKSKFPKNKGYAIYMIEPTPYVQTPEQVLEDTNRLKRQMVEDQWQYLTPYNH